MKRLTILGIACADVAVTGYQAPPTPGRLEYVEALSLHSGGCALNVAVDLAKMAIPTKVCVPLADDFFGRFLLDVLTTHAIDSRYCIRLQDSVGTSASIVLINAEGERGFLHYPGVNAVFKSSDLPTDLLEETDVLLITGALIMANFDGQPMADFLRKARAKGIMTIVDTADDPSGCWGTVLEPCYPFIDLFVPSEAEAVHLSGLKDPADIVAYLRKRGVGDVVIKRGAHGYVAALGHRWIEAPAEPVAHVVDTTGAGDAFVAGLLAGIAYDFQLEAALNIANQVGAQAVTAKGASTAITRPKALCARKESSL